MRAKLHVSQDTIYTLWKETQQNAETYLIFARNTEPRRRWWQTANTPSNATGSQKPDRQTTQQNKLTPQSCQLHGQNCRPSGQTCHAGVRYTPEAFPLSPCSLSPSLLILIPYEIHLSTARLNRPKVGQLDPWATAQVTPHHTRRVMWSDLYSGSRVELTDFRSI